LIQWKKPGRGTHTGTGKEDTTVKQRGDEDAGMDEHDE
jgi:hypothetical protein